MLVSVPLVVHRRCLRTSLSTTLTMTDIKATGLWSFSDATTVYLGTRMIADALKQHSTTKS